jgi:hypothetical protein
MITISFDKKGDENGLKKEISRGSSQQREAGGTMG